MQRHDDTPTQYETGWPSLPTLLWLFLGLRIPLLLLERPGGYLRPFPALGTLGSGVVIGWRDWVYLKSLPLHPLVLDRLSGWLTTDLSRQLTIAGLSLPFEAATLVLLYLLARRRTDALCAPVGETRARRTAFFWGALWFPAWSWLTGLEGSGVALTLLTAWLIDVRRHRTAALAAIVTLLWMPAALVVLAPVAGVAWWRGEASTSGSAWMGWRLAGLLLLILLLLRPRTPDPLLLLLPLVALLLPTVRGAILAVLVSLLFVLHEPFAPLLLTIESRVPTLLLIGMDLIAVGLGIELARPLLHETLRRRSRRLWAVAAGGATLLLCASVPVVLTEYSTIAGEVSPYAVLVPEFRGVPDRGYVLAGTHEIYEQVYALAWRRHTVRVVTERNVDTLLTQLQERPGPVWTLAHPDDDTVRPLLDRLRAEGYPAGGGWFGDIRLERFALTPASPPERIDEAFADAVTLEEAAWQRTAVAGEWVPVELTWALPPGGFVPSSIFVHLLEAEGERMAQHDSRPEWTGDRLTTRHALRLPPELSQGSYTLIVGRYLPETNQRVMLADGEDSITVGTVKLTGSSSTEEIPRH